MISYIKLSPGALLKRKHKFLLLNCASLNILPKDYFVCFLARIYIHSGAAGRRASRVAGRRFGALKIYF